MMPLDAPPQLNPLVDAVFDSMPEPDGYEFQMDDGHYLWPVFGQDSWRLIMRDTKTGEKVPVFFQGNLVRYLINALKTTHEEIQKAVPPSLNS